MGTPDYCPKMVGWKQRAHAAAAGGLPVNNSRSLLPDRLPSILLRWLMEWAWGAKSVASMAEDAYAYCEGSDRRVVDRRIQRLAKTKGEVIMHSVWWWDYCLWMGS